MGTKKAMLLSCPHLRSPLRSVEQIHDLHSWYISILEIKVSELFRKLTKEIQATNSAIYFAAIWISNNQRSSDLQITTYTFKPPCKSACWHVLLLGASILTRVTARPAAGIWLSMEKGDGFL